VEGCAHDPRAEGTAQELVGSGNDVCSWGLVTVLGNAWLFNTLYLSGIVIYPLYYQH